MFSFRHNTGFSSFSNEKNTIFKLQKLYVDNQIQGQGVGLLLLKNVISEVKIAGASKLILNVNRRNKALNFYLKNGFKIILEEDIAIGNNYFMNDYVMELDIEMAK